MTAPKKKPTKKMVRRRGKPDIKDAINAAQAVARAALTAYKIIKPMIQKSRRKKAKKPAPVKA